MKKSIIVLALIVFSINTIRSQNQVGSLSFVWQGASFTIPQKIEPTREKSYFVSWPGFGLFANHRVGYRFMLHYGIQVEGVGNKLIRLTDRNLDGIDYELSFGGRDELLNEGRYVLESMMEIPISASCLAIATKGNFSNKKRPKELAGLFLEMGLYASLHNQVVKDISGKTARSDVGYSLGGLFKIRFGFTDGIFDPYISVRQDFTPFVKNASINGRTIYNGIRRTRIDIGFGFRLVKFIKK